MSCCPAGAAPYLAAEHEDEGSVRSMDGVPFYQVGTGQTGLLILPDIWGWNGGRTRAIADMFAKKGLSVYVPKLLESLEGGTDGDGLPPNFALKERMSEVGPLFKGAWNQTVTVPKALKVVNAMKAAGIKKMGLLGFCYGGWVGCHLSKDVKFVCAASPHPSHHIEVNMGFGEVGKLG